MEEEEKLAVTNQEFSDEMLYRVLEKEEEGYEGWDERENAGRFFTKIDTRNFRTRFEMGAKEPDWEEIQEECINIANYAMFLWKIANLEQEKYE